MRGLLAEGGISVREFAAACGISRAYASQIVSGRLNPGPQATDRVRTGPAVLGLLAVLEGQAAHAS